MAEEWCDFHDLPLNSCPHSIPEDRNPQVLDLEADGPTIEATQNGGCAADCGRRIHEGDQITHTPEGWAHTEEVSGAGGVGAGTERRENRQPGIFDDV